MMLQTSLPAPRLGPFRPTTKRFRAVQPSVGVRRRLLVRKLTSITRDDARSDALIDDAVREFGGDDVPDDDALYEVFVRQFVVPRVVPFGSMRAIAAMLEHVS